MPLLETVLGRSADALDFAAAVLPAYAVMAAAEGPFPVLISAPGQEAVGVVLRGLGSDDIDRLNYYEAGFDYGLSTLTLIGGEPAEVYVPAPGLWSTEDAWDFAVWEAKWAAMSVAAAVEVMDGFGTLTAEEIARRFPRIRARAWSQVNAQNNRYVQNTLDGKVDVIRRTRAHSNFFALDEITLRHETFAGDMTDPLHRSVFVSSDAAIVLPYDPMRDRVLLIEQIRLGPIGRGDPVVWQMEPVAGLIDPGETPAETAHREAMEEAGLTFSKLEAAGECYASPGSATDFFYLYVGLCDLPDDIVGVSGAEEEGENIRSHVMCFEDLMKMAEERRTANAPLTLMAYWLAYHRGRLRTEAGVAMG